MANKFSQGIYECKNPGKYVGKGTIRYRSGWEKSFMHFLDEHPSVESWASECFMIPYFDPLTNKKKNYIPDFFIVYKSKTGQKIAEIVEVKPFSQTGQKKTKSIRDTAAAIRNHAKWASAVQFAQKNNCTFRVITENEMFGKI